MIAENLEPRAPVPCISLTTEADSLSFGFAKHVRVI